MTSLELKQSTCKLLYIISILAIVTGCKGTVEMDKTTGLPDYWNQTTMIEYRFGDSSLPPDYHRSYTIAVTENQVSFTIDSYGDVLLKREYPNTSEAFTQFRDQLSKEGIKTRRENDNTACSGGTSESIRLYNVNECYFSGHVYHCGGDNGNMILPDGTPRLIRRQIPEDVDSLIESTLKSNFP